MNISTHLGRFRLIALIEGISFLLLLFIAMPMKYWAGMPQAVAVAGMAHGVLFIAYMLFLILVKEDQSWSFSLVFKSALVSLLPFGTFYADKHWWSPVQKG
ncbi:MAG TPA: hypothetical protein DIW47_06185 [Bacteroidetes bacterium]|nr:hypothetical protein [Bacteroidota bacterium]